MTTAQAGGEEEETGWSTVAAGDFTVYSASVCVYMLVPFHV